MRLSMYFFRLSVTFSPLRRVSWQIITITIQFVFLPLNNALCWPPLHKIYYHFLKPANRNICKTGRGGAHFVYPLQKISTKQHHTQANCPTMRNTSQQIVQAMRLWLWLAALNMMCSQMPHTVMISTLNHSGDNISHLFNMNNACHLPTQWGRNKQPNTVQSVRFHDYNCCVNRFIFRQHLSQDEYATDGARVSRSYALKGLFTHTCRGLAKSLAKRHGRGTAWYVCELAFRGQVDLQRQREKLVQTITLYFVSGFDGRNMEMQCHFRRVILCGATRVQSVLKVAQETKMFKRTCTTTTAPVGPVQHGQTWTQHDWRNNSEGVETVVGEW